MFDTIKVQLDQGAYMPEKAHNWDAGFDLRTPLNVWIPPHNSMTINTGIHMAIPQGFVGFIKSKSGLNVNYGLTAEGVIDAGYTGSIVVKMYNNSNKGYTFHAGEKLTQIVILPIPDFDLQEVDSLESDTERGNNGFGSTGK